MCAAFPPTADERSAYAWLIGNLQAHHLVKQQRLRKAGRHALILDERMGLCLCEWHHQRHENRRQPVPTRLIGTDSIEVIEGAGFGWILHNEREYP